MASIPPACLAGKGMAEERYVVVSDLAFVVREQPSADCLSAQHAEERRRHLKRPDVFGAGTRAHLESLEPIERLRFEHLGERETIEIVRHRGPSPFHASAGERVVLEDQPVGGRIRERPQQHGLHDGEDGRVRADAQSERQNGCRREGSILDEQTQCELQVLEERVHGSGIIVRF